MTEKKVKFSFINQEQLPLVVLPVSEDLGNIDNLIQFLQENNKALKEKLIEYGAILFRGFHCDSTESFSKVIQACSLGTQYKYDLCEVPRTKISEYVYTSTNLPPQYPLELHNEKSHDAYYPTHVFFACIQKAKEGGMTPLADAHKVWQSLPIFLQEKLIAKGIKYRKFSFGNGFYGKLLSKLIPDFHQYTWMSKCNTKDKETVEQQLRALGCHFQWTWDDNLIGDYILPAYKIHPITKKIIWFNQSNHLNYYNNSVLNYYKNIIKNPFARYIFLKYNHAPFRADFGDGACFTKEESNLINEALTKNTVATPWQNGDFLILDNYSCMHAKTPHVGERLILAGLTRFDYEGEKKEI